MRIERIQPSTHADGYEYDPIPQVFPTLDLEVRPRSSYLPGSHLLGGFRLVARRYVDNGGKARTLQGDAGGTRYEDPKRIGDETLAPPTSTEGAQTCLDRNRCLNESRPIAVSIEDRVWDQPSTPKLVAR